MADKPIQRGHPKGLYLLFTVEMWERMSYYGMRALLTLYMVSKTTDENAGFGFSKPDALAIYAWYTGLVYLTPLLGGFLADRYLGQRRAVLIGAALMTIGHFLMALPGHFFFYSALVFLIIGNGFFKPNISTMVGALYEPGDPRRDGAFTIFYMGINLGAVMSALICGTLGEKVGFHWGFGSAGVGMALGLVIFWFGAPRLLPAEVGAKPKPQTAEEAKQKHAPLTRDEIDRITVILVLAVFVVFFWAAFEQAGGLMNIYTYEKVDRTVLGFEVPASWFQSVNPAIIFIFAPLFSWLWGYLGRKGIDPPTPVKMAFGLVLLSLGFVFMLHAVNEADAGHTGLASLFWVVAAYFWHTMGELCLSPIGLSMVTKLSPARMVSMLMGAWFFANFVANLAAGYIGGYAEQLGEYDLFGAIIVGTTAAGMVLFLASRRLVRMMHMPSDGKSWGWGAIGIACAVTAVVMFGYPRLLGAERATAGFECAWDQREAKKNLYAIYDKQKAFYEAAREGQDGVPEAEREKNATFTTDLDAIGFFVSLDRVDFTQREAQHALSEIHKAQSELFELSATDAASRRYATTFEELKMDKPKTEAYEVTLEGDGKSFRAKAVRTGSPTGRDGKDYAGDTWTIDEKGHLENPGRALYEYRMVKADEHGFVAEARRRPGTGGLEGDTWTLDDKRNLVNTTGGCQSHAPPPPAAPAGSAP